MKKTRILPLLAVALLCNCGGSDDKGPETGDGKITVVEPTTGVGRPERRHLPAAAQTGQTDYTQTGQHDQLQTRRGGRHVHRHHGAGRHRLRRRNVRCETRRTVFRGGSGNRLRRGKPVGRPSALRDIRHLGDRRNGPHHGRSETQSRDNQRHETHVAPSIS